MTKKTLPVWAERRLEAWERTMTNDEGAQTTEGVPCVDWAEVLHDEPGLCIVRGLYTDDIIVLEHGGRHPGTLNHYPNQGLRAVFVLPADEIVRIA